MARGFIVSDMQYGSLKITDHGFLLLKGEADFRYRPDAKLKKAMRKVKNSDKPISDLPEAAEMLLQALKTLRSEIAKERSVPAYIIFRDKSLIDMALNKPVTLDQFGDVFGVGASKLKEFGEKFMKVIRENS